MFLWSSVRCDWGWGILIVLDSVGEISSFPSALGGIYEVRGRIWLLSFGHEGEQGRAGVVEPLIITPTIPPTSDNDGSEQITESARVERATRTS